MTKQTASVDMSGFTTDAKFRAWVLAAETALAACGLTRTADTGQINTATVTKPVATNTKAGYSVWAFADTLQATKPIVFRIDYGSGAVASGNGPSTWITMGTSSNGSGTITGTTVPVIQTGYGGTTGPANISMTMMFTHSTANGYALLHFGLASLDASGTVSSSTPGVYVIERTKDSSGTPTSSGVGFSYLTYAAAASWRYQGINFDTTTAYGTAHNVYCGTLSDSNSLTTGGNVVTYKHYHGLGAPYYALGMLSSYINDITNSTVFSATPLGATAHSYYHLLNAVQCSASASSNIAASFMWED